MKVQAYQNTINKKMLKKKLKKNEGIWALQTLRDSLGSPTNLYTRGTIFLFRRPS